MSSTRRRDAVGRWLTIAGLVVAVAIGALSGACGPADEGPTTTELVVPRGTAEKLAQGEAVTVMPTELHFEVGDTLRIRNEDVAAQSVGPYRVDAGDQFEVTFNAPGRFEGVCPLAEEARYEIVVTA